MYTRLVVTSLVGALLASPAVALGATGVVAGDTTKLENPAATTINTQPATVIQHMRLQDQRGINVFEAPKFDNVPYTGFRLDWGAAFAQQFQSITHSNAAPERLVNGVNANQLMDIGAGFNNASANLNMNAQLAPGIRVALTTYLSSRHHPEAWVKDGYLLIDESPIRWAPLQTLMNYTTVRAGHFEVNYGDAHFRRTDNGNAIYNPFVGNYIMDSFTTEVGAEVYLRHKGFLAMGGFTGGEIKGNTARPNDRAPSWLGKLGYDNQITQDLRVRLTGSLYTTEKSISNTMYGGDRAGSRYYNVLENTTATEAANFTSGHINPGFRNKVTAYQLNPFVKFGGLELFGVAETATGRAANETEDRTFKQYAGDVVYRFLPGEKLYVGGRYNTVNGTLAGSRAEVSIDRTQFSGGWFVTPSILLKGEYVTQKYNDFPTLDIRNGGKFNGFVIEGVVAF